LGAYRLHEITTSILTKWTDALALTGLSYSSCFRLFWQVKYILNCAVNWKVLPSNAAFKDANLPAKPGRQPVVLSSQEIERLIAIIKNYHHRASANAIHLMLLTGATKSEILFARWEYVDLKNGLLRTEKTYTGRPHLIPLNNEALKLIRSLPLREGVPWLFFTRNGTRLANITREWYEIRSMLGRTDLRLQDLRHTFAHFLVSIGIKQRDLRSIMGHYKPETLALVRNHSIENKNGTR
jgi:integrase